jgi:adenine/guanine phosphoribosyltransferase-like PRPP-binding protein
MFLAGLANGVEMSNSPPRWSPSEGRRKQRELSALKLRGMGIPTEARFIFSHRSDSALKVHPDFKAAKRGDVEAAARLVEAAASPTLIEKAKALGPDAIFAPVAANEASGPNAIPALAAALCAAHAGARTDGRICQANEAHHTGAGAMERLAIRPLFDGPVAAGGKYVPVDDVTVMGSTLAEMANHIRQGGGDVVGVISLANAGRSEHILPQPSWVLEIERRFGDVLRDEFGLEPSALTAAEAAYLLNFKGADALRTRRTAALHERSARLRAKGVCEVPPVSKRT